MSSRSEDLLKYFERAVLTKYRASPDIYELEEQRMGGQIINKGEESWYQIRFAFRQLVDGRICVAAFEPDLAKLPTSEKHIWFGNQRNDFDFAIEDTPFRNWVSINLNSEFIEIGIENRPIDEIKKQVKYIRALTESFLGKPLFRQDEDLKLIKYPIAENNEAYHKAHLELYRFIIDELNKDALCCLANYLRIKLEEPRKTLNSLKEILSSDQDSPNLVNEVHTPLKQKSSKKRQPIHGIPKEIKECSAFCDFHDDLLSIAQALIRLREWLEQKSGYSAECCLERRNIMSSLFPEIIGKPRPNFKLKEIKKAEGKTIKLIEFGEEEDYGNKHLAEAIVIHFSDGTSMAIRVGSNACNLSSIYEELNPNDVSTDLVVFWAPAIRKSQDKDD